MTTDNSNIISNFVNGKKTKIIAPAGYGKTHFISDCIKYTFENKLGKQLILTHTHAGVASIRAKLFKNNIPTSAYKIETICGYAQKYVFSFIKHSAIPNQENKNFYPFIIDCAINLFSKRNIQQIIQKTYSGIFIDEYQDCTKEQQNMLMKLKDIIPLHILGDPLQGIFDFNNIVDFDTDLNDFTEYDEKLTIPWRWSLNGNNFALGKDLQLIRETLLANNNIKLDKNIYPNIKIKIITGNIYKNKEYKKNLYKELDSNNILIITNGQINQRKKIRSTLGKYINIQLLEAIDDKDFYSISHDFDSLITSKSQYKSFIKILEKIFTEQGIKTWFNKNGLIKKKDAIAKIFSDKLYPYVKKLSNNIATYNDLYNMFLQLKNHLTCWRKDLLFSVIISLKNATLENSTVYTAMCKHKNHIRIVGRKIYGKCLGTTLLTKGLEFDNVVILDAQDFTDKKSFYVAVTRACKNLTIFTTTTNLIFK